MSSLDDLDLAASKRGVSFNRTSPAVLGLVIFSPMSPLTKHDFLMGPDKCHSAHHVMPSTSPRIRSSSTLHKIINFHGSGRTETQFISN